MYFHFAIYERSRRTTRRAKLTDVNVLKSGQKHTSRPQSTSVCCNKWAFFLIFPLLHNTGTETGNKLVGGGLENKN